MNESDLSRLENGQNACDMAKTVQALGKELTDEQAKVFIEKLAKKQNASDMAPLARALGDKLTKENVQNFLYKLDYNQVASGMAELAQALGSNLKSGYNPGESFCFIEKLAKKQNASDMAELAQALKDKLGNYDEVRIFLDCLDNELTVEGMKKIATALGSKLGAHVPDFLGHLPDNLKTIENINQILDSLSSCDLSFKTVENLCTPKASVQERAKLAQKVRECLTEAHVQALLKNLNENSQQASDMAELSKALGSKLTGQSFNDFLGKLKKGQ